MAHNKHFSSEVRDHATDGRSPHAHRGWTDFLAHRWPTALGIAVAALTAFDLRIDVESVSFLSALVVPRTSTAMSVRCSTGMGTATWSGSSPKSKSTRPAPRRRQGTSCKRCTRRPAQW